MFYWPYSPVAHEDAQKIASYTLNEKLEYLKERLKSLKYLDEGKSDPMKSPDVIFATGNYDCEDGVAYVATVLRLLRVPHTVYIGYVVQDNNKIGHVWLEVDDHLFETTIPDVMSKSEESVKYYPVQYIYCDRKGDLHNG